MKNVTQIAVYNFQHSNVDERQEGVTQIIAATSGASSGNVVTTMRPRDPRSEMLQTPKKLDILGPKWYKIPWT